MAIDHHGKNQKRIVSQAIVSGNGPPAGLTENQAAAQQAIRAVAELMALIETIKIDNAKLTGMVAPEGWQRLANDTGLMAQTSVTDWIEFENRLARAGAALYCASQMRGMVLDRLVRARLRIDAEIKARDERQKSRV